jgi:hypothetical protein
MLTQAEQQYFNDTIDLFKQVFNIYMPIEPFDHETLKGKDKKALGLAYSLDNGITLDKITICKTQGFFIFTF